VTQHPIYGVNQGLTTKNWWKDFVHQVFVNAGSLETPSDINKVFEILWTRFAKAKNWDVMPDAHDTLAFLKSSGIRLGVISNFDDRLENTLRANNLDKYFDFLVTSHGAKIEKPDPAIFRLALKMSGRTAHEAAHIGDDIRCDYIASRNVGMTSFLFDPDGQHTTDSLRLKKVDASDVVRNLAELKTLVR